jgi:uncharacterized caspase-like protein
MAEGSKRRVALVIGNTNYRYGPPLRNPHQDAEALTGVLSRLGFEPMPSQAAPRRGWHADLDLITMRRVIADFGIAADGADMAAIYFAGHGMEVDGENYLLPVDAELDHLRRVRAETCALNELLADVAGVKTLPLVILDACRDNPFVIRMRGIEAKRSLRSGLADIEPAGDVLVAYAARHGAKALDGPEGGNSPFAVALIEHLETPDVDIRILLGRVRDTVREATKRVQLPHIYGSLGGAAVYLKRSGKAPEPHTEEISPPVEVLVNPPVPEPQKYRRLRALSATLWQPPRHP